MTIEDSTTHSRWREMFTSAFSERALIAQTELFTKHADKLVDVLRVFSEDKSRCDLVQMFNFISFDIMGEFAFSEPLHMLENGEYDPWVRTIFQNIKRGVILNLVYTYYPRVAKVLHLLLHSTIAKLQNNHLQYVAGLVTTRKTRQEPAGSDLWSRVLKGQQGLSREEMDSNASLFMLAGTETTATLLSGLTYLLLTHPLAMKELVTKIRKTFTETEDINLETLAQLPFLNACIKEALRLYPPVPVGLPHRTSEGTRSSICGFDVPPNVG
jgi:cytochrome P450